MNKEDKRDLLKLADIIEGKKFFNAKKAFRSSFVKKCLPENKRDGMQFNLQHWFFDCGMPSCVAGHAVVEFKERFGYSNINPFKPGINRIDSFDFGRAFNLAYADAHRITMPNSYKGANPTPKTVARRIREVVAKLC